MYRQTCFKEAHYKRSLCSYEGLYEGFEAQEICKIYTTGIFLDVYQGHWWGIIGPKLASLTQKFWQLNIFISVLRVCSLLSMSIPLNIYSF